MLHVASGTTSVDWTPGRLQDFFGSEDDPAKVADYNSPHFAEGRALGHKGTLLLRPTAFMQQLILPSLNTQLPVENPKHAESFLSAGRAGNENYS
ncbi:hypothetical protein JCM11251_007645 [Rhodosporidiobolus azoricus]